MSLLWLINGRQRRSGTDAGGVRIFVERGLGAASSRITLSRARMTKCMIDAGSASAVMGGHEVHKQPYRLRSLLPPPSATRLRAQAPATLGTRLRDRGTHERVHELLQDDLTRNGLQDLDNGCEVELFDGARCSSAPPCSSDRATAPPPRSEDTSRRVAVPCHPLPNGHSPGARRANTSGLSCRNPRSA